jgi:hypothetical protein
MGDGGDALKKALLLITGEFSMLYKRDYRSFTIEY